MLTLSFLSPSPRCAFDSRAGPARLSLCTALASRTQSARRASPALAASQQNPPSRRPPPRDNAPGARPPQRSGGSAPGPSRTEPTRRPAVPRPAPPAPAKQQQPPAPPSPRPTPPSPQREQQPGAGPSGDRPGTGGIRVNKCFREFASRREADDYVERGRVTINGKVAVSGDRVRRGFVPSRTLS